MSSRRFLLLSASNNGGGSEIEFYLKYSSIILKYIAIPGMTWAQFIDSDYNIDNKIGEYSGGIVVFNSNGMPYPIIDGSISVNIDDYIKPNHQYIAIAPGAD